MSKILRRPMFRGGSVSSYGNGIASGLADGGRVKLQKGGDPWYQSGYSAVPKGSVTGGDVKKMAEKKVFLSGLGKDTAALDSNIQDLYMNWIQRPLEKAGNKAIDYAFGTEFEDKNKGWIGNDTRFEDIYREKVWPEASKLSEELIPQISSEDEYEEAYMTEPEVALRNEARKKSYIDNAVSSPREEAIMNQDYSDLKKLLDKQRTDPNEGKGGGVDASKDDFEIPAGVSEQDQGETVTSGEKPMGLQESADAYYEMMSMGEEERKNQRAEEAAKRRETAMSKARTGDVSDYLLKFFEGSQKEGATVGSSAADVAAFATAKDSKTEKAMAKADAREEAIMDRGYAREDALRDRATATAIKEKFTQMGFDWKDMRSEKDFDNKMEMLKIQLDSAESIAEKKIIAARINTLEQMKNKIFAPGITEKDITWAMKQPKDSAEYTAWLNKNNYASTLEAHVKDQAERLDGRPMSNSQINKLGPLYYDDWGGIFIQDGDQKDGTYLDTKMNEIVTIKDGKVVESLTESLTVS